MKLTFHPFLFSIIPPLFVLANNLDDTNFREIWFILLIIVAISSSSWFVCRIILKSTIKSALIISLALVIFFSYGHYYNLVYEQIEKTELGHHRYLLIPFITAFIIGTIYFVKTQRKLDNANMFANVMSLVIVVMIFINIGTYELQHRGSFIENNDNIKLIKPENSPDVYYIILDKYAGANTLTKIFNYDNHEFLNFLRERGFQIVEEGYSNYPNTRTSLASTLNMEYLHNLIAVPSNSTNKWPLNYLVTNNVVMKNFKSIGYEIITFDSGVTLTNSFTFTDKNLCGKEFLNYDVINQLFETTMLEPFSVALTYEQVRENRLCVFSEFPKIGAKTDKPVFVFAHMLMPHAPYLFGENGELINPDSLVAKLGSNEIDIAYLNQLKFTNKKMQDVVDEILKSSEGNSIIVIQGDHGYNDSIDWEFAYDNLDPKMIKQSMNIFNAYYLPQHGRDAFYDEITPVNTFRLVFNEYFNGTYTPLDDKIYFNTVELQFSWKDATLIVDKKN